MVTDPTDLLPLAADVRSLFRSAGYTVDGVGAVLGETALAALGRGDAVPALLAAEGGSALEVLLRLFLLGSAEPAEAASFVPEATLEQAGDGRVRAAVDLRPHEDDWWVASDAGHEYPPATDHVIGIGSASLTLLGATMQRPVDSALDLGTGCGVQALHMTRIARKVTATDAVRRAVDMARLSFALSGFGADAIEVLQGDLFAPVDGRLFDLVVSNPPFVLAPPGQDALAYRDAAGGDDSQLGRLLADATLALVPGGVAQVLTSWLVGADGDWQRRPSELLPAGCDALVLLREVLDPAEHVALWRDDAAPPPVAVEQGRRWLRHLSAMGSEGVAYGLVVLRRTDAQPRIRLLDLTGEPNVPSGERLGGWLDRTARVRAADFGSLRLRAAGDIRLVESSVPGSEGWEPAERRVISPSALPETVAVDPITKALIAGCHGTLPAQAIAELLATASGVPAGDVLRVTAELFETGHLVLAD